MPRYFIDIAYKGTAYAGFQVQRNAGTIQGEIDRALSVLLREKIQTTGSSRTDAGVHARHNFAHFDTEVDLHPQFVYKINALLPRDIAINAVDPVDAEAHSRFDAVSRAYEYTVYTGKDPFLKEFGYFYPYRLHREVLQQAAMILQEYTDFTAFSKRNTQVKTFNCRIISSGWHFEEGRLLYRVTANRFLRGMVRGLVGTMLLVGRNKLTMEEFREIIEGKDNTKVNFGVPPQGLFLTGVRYPEDILEGRVL